MKINRPSQYLNLYLLLLPCVLLSVFLFVKWLFDPTFRPIEYFYWFLPFAYFFNFRACYIANIRQIFVGRLLIMVLAIWPLVIMYHNLHLSPETMGSQISWASFFLLGALAVPVALVGELLLHLGLVICGYNSSHDVSKSLSIDVYFMLEASRYIFWIWVQWMVALPLAIKYLRKRQIKKRFQYRIKSNQ